MDKERLTKFVSPVGVPMTTLDSMKHYMPCISCRHNAKTKTDSNGKQYTEKHDFCDTCEVKMLFNRLKEYEDLEEQGLLLRLPCKVGSEVYYILGVPQKTPCVVEKASFELSDINKIGKTLFLTQAEAEEKLK